jgi:hypothetical protein
MCASLDIEPPKVFQMIPSATRYLVEHIAKRAQTHGFRLNQQIEKNIELLRKKYQLRL